MFSGGEAIVAAHATRSSSLKNARDADGCFAHHALALVLHIDTFIAGRTSPEAEQNFVAADVDASNAHALERRMRARSDERRERGELFTSRPRARARNHDARPIGHDDGIERAFATGRAELVVERDERIDTAAATAFVVFTYHARIVRKACRRGQL